jgi:hypothetical protein
MKHAGTCWLSDPLVLKRRNGIKWRFTIKTMELNDWFPIGMIEQL